MDTVIDVKGLGKTFTLHSQSGAQIPVFRGLDLTVSRGECLALHGPSGSGKSTLLRCLYANYKPQHGSICILHQGDYVDIASAEPRTVLAVRKYSVGYVSQFLRVIPRVPTLDVVARARMDVSGSRGEALRQAKELLTRLNIPQRLWPLSPVTFSGGEQQRVNIARSFIVDYPILLLDEPTASLDKENRKIVVDMINTAKTRGTAVVGIFHDEEVRASVADRILDFTPMENAA